MKFTKETKVIFKRDVIIYTYSKNIRITYNLVPGLFLLNVFAIHETHKDLESAKASLQRHLEILKNFNISLIERFQYFVVKGSYFNDHLASLSMSDTSKYLYKCALYTKEGAKKKIIQDVTELLNQVK